MVFEIFICFLAGTGAGLGTGFAGMSAATVISPMLLTFLGPLAYDTIGIALASDVPASAVSARTYARQGYLDLKNGLVMMAGVLSMTMAGSWLSSFVPDGTLGSFSVVMTLVLGLKFLLVPVASGQEETRDPAHRFLKGAVGGCVIGLICGFFGAGGGMMMLLVLTSFLGYPLKTAVVVTTKNRAPSTASARSVVALTRKFPLRVPVTMMPNRFTSSALAASRV